MQIRGFWLWALVGVLLVSLGVNFFLAGFLFERARRGWAGGPLGVARVLDDFPPDVRRSIGRQLWQERRQFRGAFDEVREKRRQIVDAMRAAELDPARIRALMGEVRGLTNTLQERAQDSIIDALARMSPQERAEIGEWRRGRQRGALRPPGEDDGPDEPPRPR